MLRAVLFDLDDTLVDQANAARSAVVGWACEHGHHGPEVADRWADIAERSYERYQRRELTFTGQRRARVREFLALDLTDEEADGLFASYLSRYQAAWTVFDDAVPALRQVRRAGLAAGVLTNGEEDHQRFKLSSLGLEPHVDVLVASSSLPRGKPDPMAFRGACERLGLAPGAVLMVGDSLEKDVYGAFAAGLDAVWLDRLGKEPAPAGVRRITTLEDLVR